MGIIKISKKLKKLKFRAIANTDLVVNYYRVKRNCYPFISFIKIGLALN